MLPPENTQPAPRTQSATIPLIIAAAAVATFAIVGITVATVASSPAPATSSAAEVRAQAQEEAVLAAAEQADLEAATHAAVAANAAQIAAILTRNSHDAGALTVLSYVEGLGVSETAIDRALAAQFAGADVIVDYVKTDTAPVVRIWHEEDYKVTVNISNSVAEVFIPIS